ncbi:MAG: prepilin-type N-terminal cleavage/methylation domain-containing protein [Phycisphaerales bacterium]|nr:prepilin-type N-terminal cleavage/methylation domain-containing protein [Phycisphaerales bacterium]
MKVARRIRKAFTLVEILIVVVILGILAAIVVPQFTNAANEARGGNIDTQESTIQNQLELYAARNNGQYPDLTDPAEDWDALVTGGYFKEPPQNPYTNAGDPEGVVLFGGAATTIADVEAEAAIHDPDVDAWVYNLENGIIRASRGGL